MYLQCTQSLLKELGIKPRELLSAPYNENTSWQANIFIAGHRKTVVLVHDTTRYVVVMFGLRKKDFQNFESAVISAVYDALLHSQIAPVIAKKYADSISPLSFGHTQNRSEVRYLNLPCTHAKSMVNRGFANRCLIPQGKISLGYNLFNFDPGTKDRNGEWKKSCSLVRMLDFIASMYPDTAIKYFDAIQLKATLQMRWAKGDKDISLGKVIPSTTLVVHNPKSVMM